MPLPRFTYHHHALSGRWSVYDRLLYYRVYVKGSGVVAANLAHDHEAAWRRQCERWIAAEHRDGMH